VPAAWAGWPSVATVVLMSTTAGVILPVIAARLSCWSGPVGLSDEVVCGALRIGAGAAAAGWAAWLLLRTQPAAAASLRTSSPETIATRAIQIPLDPRRVGAGCATGRAAPVSPGNSPELAGG
jgi:hypothetical protein